ncbi:MAG: DUF1311 domain-containing protein [Chitinophagales bacterium]|nr:DUF1311 domain-containing protein [Chitinophagales bacterium]
MFKSSGILAFLIVFGNSSFAQTQAEMNEQAQKEFMASDKIMAANYKKLMAKENAVGKKLLLEAQRAWIKYKETHCKLESNDAEGGSMQPLLLYTCLKELTDERNKKLEALLELKEL